MKASAAFEQQVRRIYELIAESGAEVTWNDHIGDPDNPTTRLPVTARPEDIHMLVAGGRSYFAAVLPGWGGFGGFAVTRQIE